MRALIQTLALTSASLAKVSNRLVILVPINQGRALQSACPQASAITWISQAKQITSLVLSGLGRIKHNNPFASMQNGAIMQMKLGK